MNLYSQMFRTTNEGKNLELIRCLQSSRDKLTPIVNDVIISSVDFIQRGDGLFFSKHFLTLNQYKEMLRASLLLKEAQFKCCFEPRFHLFPNTNFIVNRLTEENFTQRPPGVLIDEGTIIALLEVYERIGEVIRTLSDDCCRSHPRKSIEEIPQAVQRRGNLMTAIKSPSSSNMILKSNRGSMTGQSATRAFSERNYSNHSQTVRSASRMSANKMVGTTDSLLESPFTPEREFSSHRWSMVSAPKDVKSYGGGAVTNTCDICKDNFKIQIRCNMSDSEDDDDETLVLHPAKSEKDCYRVKLGERPVAVKAGGEGTYCINAQSEDEQQEIKIIIKSHPDCDEQDKDFVHSTTIDDSDDGPRFIDAIRDENEETVQGRKYLYKTETEQNDDDDVEGALQVARQDRFLESGVEPISRDTDNCCTRGCIPQITINIGPCGVTCECEETRRIDQQPKMDVVLDVDNVDRSTVSVRDVRGEVTDPDKPTVEEGSEKTLIGVKDPEKSLTDSEMKGSEELIDDKNLNTADDKDFNKTDDNDSNKIDDKDSNKTDDKDFNKLDDKDSNKTDDKDSNKSYDKDSNKTDDKPEDTSADEDKWVKEPDVTSIDDEKEPEITTLDDEKEPNLISDEEKETDLISDDEKEPEENLDDEKKTPVKKKVVFPLLREKTCSSLEFEVSDADTRLREEEIEHSDSQIVEEFRKLGVDQLLRASRPAKCCRKAILNERQRTAIPYSASLRSLPLSVEDVNVVRQSIEMSVRKIKNSLDLTETQEENVAYNVTLEPDHFPSNLSFPWSVPIYNVTVEYDKFKKKPKMYLLKKDKEKLLQHMKNDQKKPKRVWSGKCYILKKPEVDSRKWMSKVKLKQKEGTKYGIRKSKVLFKRTWRTFGYEGITNSGTIFQESTSVEDIFITRSRDEDVSESESCWSLEGRDLSYLDNQKMKTVMTREEMLAIKDKILSTETSSRDAPKKKPDSFSADVNRFLGKLIFNQFSCTMVTTFKYIFGKFEKNRDNS